MVKKSTLAFAQSQTFPSSQSQIFARQSCCQRSRTQTIQGKNGGLYYRTKSGKAYVDAAFVKKHKASPKRKRSGASPKRHRRKASPKRHRRRTSQTSSCVSQTQNSPFANENAQNQMGLRSWRQPSLIDMMGPMSLTIVPRHQGRPNFIPGVPNPMP